jgi:hypothetical protein
MSPNLAFRRQERESERSRVGNSWEKGEEAGSAKEFELFLFLFCFWFCTCYYLRRNANFTRATCFSYVSISGEVASTWKCSHKCVLFVVCKWEMSLGGRPPREDLKLWSRKPRNWVLKPETDSWCRRLWSKPGHFPQKIWYWQDVKTQDPRANLVLSLSLSLSLSTRMKQHHPAAFLLLATYIAKKLY